MPSTVPTVNRRHVLAGGVALALLGVAAPACGSQPPPDVDDLRSLLESARNDSELATAAAATAAPPPIASALATVASERAEHAQALATEIARVSGHATSSVTEVPASAGAETQPASGSTVADVVGALRASADSAGRLAAESSGYRAGLFGSIGAACTTADTVALAFPGVGP